MPVRFRSHVFEWAGVALETYSGVKGIDVR